MAAKQYECDVALVTGGPAASARREPWRLRRPAPRSPSIIVSARPMPKPSSRPQGDRRPRHGGRGRRSRLRPLRRWSKRSRPRLGPIETPVKNVGVAIVRGVDD